MVSSRYSYIAFEGPIGADTRDLARAVAKALDGELVEDLQDNPFLDDFYRMKEGAAFQTQMFFLLNRHQLLADVKQGHLFHDVKIANFILEKDRIYAYQTLSDSELNIYEKIYEILARDRVRPDLVIYLQMSPERILENIKRRKEARRFSIAPEYVENIVEAYNRFFFHYDDTPLIILNANHVNFEKDPGALKDLLSFFQKDLRGVTYFTPQ